MRYTVLLDPDPDGGGYTVTVPALPGCITEGATFEAALSHAREAIVGFVKMLDKLGEPIPSEDPPLIAVTLDVAPQPALAEAVAHGG